MKGVPLWSARSGVSKSKSLELYKTLLDTISPCPPIGDSSWVLLISIPHAHQKKGYTIWGLHIQVISHILNDVLAITRGVMWVLFYKTLPLSSKALLGTLSFTAAAPKIWNGLPDYIRKENDLDKFKTQTHCFKEAYSDLSWAIIGFYFLLLSSLFTSYLLWVMLNYLLGRKCNNWLSFSI